MEMIHTKYILTGLLFFFLSLTSVAQVKDIPIVKLFDKDYYKYEVKKGETLYSICRTFNTTQAEIISMNPFLTDGLKTGQTLLIQVKRAEKDQEELPEGMSKVAKENMDNSTIFIGKRSSSLIDKNLPRITLLLPFSMVESDGANDRFVEFYEGFLLAVDSLKSLGLSFEVQALYVSNNENNIQELIDAGQLDETDYCIGGTTPEGIKRLSAWSSTKQKSLILPFSTRINEINNNQYLYQPFTTYSHMYERFANYASIKFAGSNIVLLKEPENTGTKHMAFLSQIKSALAKKRLAYTEHVQNGSMEALVHSLSDIHENVLFPYEMSVSQASQFVNDLSTAAAKYPEKHITLIGYPEWQTMSKKNQQRLHELNTYLFSGFYADPQSHPVRQFQSAFNKTYGKTLLNTFPKYGMLGYDIASWFIPKMVYEKTNHPLTTGPSPLQNAYLFKAEATGSGAVNQLFYLINYTRSNTVEVKPIK